jgi:putative transposase
VLQEKLIKHGIKIGRDGLHSLLVEHGLIIRRRKKRPKTTNSKHWMKKYPNLIKEMETLAPDMIWVSDITYISHVNGFGYLSLITDAYSRKIMGYCLHPNLSNEGCINALEMALRNRQYNHQLIHHSDRGSQYCSKQYVHILGDNKVFISMTESGSPYENAKAERVNGILKTEHGLDDLFKSFDLANESVDKAVLNYNEYRPHASIDFLTPNQAYQRKGSIRKRWKKRIYNTKIEAE